MNEIATPAGTADPTLATAAAPPRPKLSPFRARRLPQERIWPGWMIAGCQIGVLIAAIAAWEYGAATGAVDAFFWSRPSAIAETLGIFVRSGDAAVDTWYTFRATILGFILGTTLGTAWGLSFWWSRNYAAIVQPYIICFESIPKLALAPLVILVFGIGLASKVALGMALTVVVSALTTYAGVKAVDRDHEKLLYSLGASRWQVFRKLVVPACLPWGISVLRVNIGLALTGAVVGEFISSQHGLGRTILYAGQTYEIGLVWVAVLVLSTLSVLMYVAVSQLERVLMKHVRH
ncbi:ABC transporter permease [Roseomonas sp. OT10]|uniref:ABC transporter permease n=1 Tax=Roseomonas cutis TaxID=2897332 RepID=UPI001E634427|nr:ABC transporter permease [Roseomonas sp. OT10]UFN46936.1 ABC transporter permease [Roseomonas sp. OT10]